MHAAPRQHHAMLLYTTAPHACSYLKTRQARAEIVLPANLSNTSYSHLVRAGFRRSGTVIYRARCDQCQACIPVRIAVERFRPNRSQRRTIQRNQNLQANYTIERKYSDEQYQLFLRYQHTRHPDDETDCSARDLYQEFILQSIVDTQLVEFRCQHSNALRIVSLFDLLDDGLSAVYNFYDPELTTASLGTWTILWQIDFCRRHKLPYLYLGLWIAEHAKMAYKTNFSALQYHYNNQWHDSAPSN